MIRHDLLDLFSLQLMASLAAKLNYEPVHYKNISKPPITNIAVEIYSSPPPPRPLNSPLYDHPRSPLEVPRETVESSFVEVSQPSVLDDTNPTMTELPPPPPPYPHSTSSTTSLHTDIGKQDGRYLEMRAAQNYRESELYGKDFLDFFGYFPSTLSPYIRLNS